MSDAKRNRARELAKDAVERGTPVAWFEALYEEAAGDPTRVPWADLVPNPSLVGWAERATLAGKDRRALKIGCGLGDDAEWLADRGFEVVAFDVSATAVAWCKRRFPDSSVHYLAADLLAPPPEWKHAFDFVLESYTLQVLPPSVRSEAMRHVARFVKRDGTLLVIARGREPDESAGDLPWPLTLDELGTFAALGLEEISLEDFLDDETPPVRRFRALYRRP